MARLSHILWLLSPLFLCGMSEPQALELAGTWHVLIHYQDSATAYPERWHWEDRIWVFEEKDSELHWTDYPIVVFEDGTGRFETIQGNPRARVLHAWEPNEAQQGEIKNGLYVNSRGSKRKSLEGSTVTGWKSMGRQYPASASIVTYSRSWRIETGQGFPLFIHEDALGGGRTENLEGQTRYETRGIEKTQDVLHGAYQRDGHRVGRFRLRRAGTTRLVPEGGLPAVFRGFQNQADDEERAAAKSEAAVQAALALEASPAEKRERVQALVRADLEASGWEPTGGGIRDQIVYEALVTRITDLVVDGKKSLNDAKIQVFRESTRSP